MSSWQYSTVPATDAASCPGIPMKYQRSTRPIPRSRARSIQASISSLPYTPRPARTATSRSWLSGESVTVVWALAATILRTRSSDGSWNCS